MSNKYFNWPDSLRRFVRFDAARSEDVNDALDEISGAMGAVEIDTKRALKLPASASDQLLDLAPEQRANLLLGFDPSGRVAAVPGGGRFAGDWATATAYLVSETFRDPVSKNIYSTVVAHTSSTVADDLAAGKIRLAVNLQDLEDARDAAAASALLAGERAAIATAQADAATVNGAVQVALATAQADAALGYRNTAGSHAATATEKAALASAASDAAALSKAAAQGSAAAAALDAQRAEDAAAGIAGGPVTSVNGKTGVVVLIATDIAPAATAAEMQAGTETGCRSMSPALVNQASRVIRSARTSNTALAAADKGKLIDITAGTFTQTFAAASSLGDGWWCHLRNSGTGDITIPAPDGRTNWIMYPGEMRLVQCDGAELRTVVLNAFYKTVTSSRNFIKPPGYLAFEGLMWGGGGSGGGGSSSSPYGGGGAGSPCSKFLIEASKLADSSQVVIGSGGASVSSSAGNTGGQSSFGGFSVLGGPGGNIGNPGIGGAQTGTADMARASRTDGGGGGAANGQTGGTGIFGAGGGGGSASTGGVIAGGASLFGGNGGNGAAVASSSSATAGAAPGGGGGGAIALGFNAGSSIISGEGARGELRIWGVI